MKKIVSLIACLLVALLFFTACEGTGYVGKYSFRMGKEGDKHMGIYLMLTDEDYEKKTEKNEKNFSLVIDVSSMFDILKELSVQENADVIELDGYYYITDSYDGKGKALHIGVSIHLVLYDEPIEISPEQVEKIIYSTIDDNSATLYIPTSVEDLMLQLKWYDYYTEHYQEWSEEIKQQYPSLDPVGTHPTADFIELIKKDDEEFRDYHTVKMGLVKE